MEFDLIVNVADQEVNRAVSVVAGQRFMQLLTYLFDGIQFHGALQQGVHHEAIVPSANVLLSPLTTVEQGFVADDEGLVAVVEPGPEFVEMGDEEFGVSIPARCDDEESTSPPSTSNRIT